MMLIVLLVAVVLVIVVGAMFSAWYGLVIGLGAGVLVVFLLAPMQAEMNRANMGAGGIGVGITIVVVIALVGLLLGGIGALFGRLF